MHVWKHQVSRRDQCHLNQPSEYQFVKTNVFLSFDSTNHVSILMITNTPKVMTSYLSLFGSCAKWLTNIRQRSLLLLDLLCCADNLGRGKMSVCPSVRHTPVFCLNGYTLSSTFVYEAKTSIGRRKQDFLAVCPSVRPSLCPLRSSIRWKRLNISSQFFFTVR